VLSASASARLPSASARSAARCPSAREEFCLERFGERLFGLRFRLPHLADPSCLSGTDEFALAGGSFGSDDRRLAFTLGAQDGSLFLAVGSNDRRFAFCLRALEHRGLEFFLAASSFHFLDGDRGFSSGEFDLLLRDDDLLPCLSFGQRSGLTRPGTLCFHFGCVPRFPDFGFFVGCSDLGIGHRLGDSSLLHRLSTTDTGIAFGFCFADLRIAFDFRSATLAECIEVALRVTDLLDGEDIDLDAHSREIGGGLGSKPLGEGLSVGVDLFDRQGAENGTEMAFECLEDDAANLVLRHPEEALDRVHEHDIVGADLHVGHGVDRDWHTFFGVGRGDLERNGHHVQREEVDALDDRYADTGATFDQTIPDGAALARFRVHDGALAAREDSDHVGRHFDDVPADDGEECSECEQDEEDGGECEENLEDRHGVPPVRGGGCVGVSAASTTAVVPTMETIRTA